MNHGKLGFIVVFLVVYMAMASPQHLAAQKLEDFSGISLGPLYHSLNYAETQSGATLDKDSGNLFGFYMYWRQDFSRFFMDADLSYSYTSTATYDGALQNGSGTTIPYSYSTEPEAFLLLHANLGYKLFEVGPVEISPVAGFGYRDWIRGIDDTATYDYREDYNWYFVNGGLRLNAKIQHWSFGLEGQIAYTISPQMETTMGGTFKDLTFPLGARTAYLASGLARFDFPSRPRWPHIFLELQPFYQHWEIGESDSIIATNIYGQTYTIHEPDSTTDIFGARLGAGIAF